MTEENDINFEEPVSEAQRTNAKSSEYSELYEQLKDSKVVTNLKPLVHQGISYIQKNPIQSSLIALGSGLLLGLLLNRRR